MGGCMGGLTGTAAHMASAVPKVSRSGSSARAAAAWPAASDALSSFLLMSMPERLITLPMGGCGSAAV